MSKFTKISQGAYAKLGKRYEYVVEISDLNPENVRVRIIEEKPIIKKIRTRYDPEISLYGDKNAEMKIMLGYDVKGLSKVWKQLFFTLTMPFYFVLVAFGLLYADKIPRHLMPDWLFGLLIGALVILIPSFFYAYYRLNIPIIAEYLQIRDLRKVLEKDGFKQT